MTLPTPSVRSFLQEYARLIAQESILETVAFFADTFLVADPGGARAVRSSDFALALPRRKHLFDQLGLRNTDMVAVDERPLDCRYVLARTRWRLEFLRPGGIAEDVFAESTYLVDGGAEPPRILLYLSHQDIFSILRERGIGE